jgi:hypothetical protein
MDCFHTLIDKVRNHGKNTCGKEICGKKANSVLARFDVFWDTEIQQLEPSSSRGWSMMKFLRRSKYVPLA